MLERRSWAVGILFVLFILFCGLTHLFAILHVRGVLVSVVLCSVSRIVFRERHVVRTAWLWMFQSV